MSNYIATARAWLATITPDLPPALLIVFVFVSVYLLRRWFPGAWVKFERAVPFVDTIDPGPGLKVLLKFWQAIPGALLAAVGGALFTGASVKLAVWAVISTAVAAAAHEIGTDYATLKTANQLRARAAGPKPPATPPNLAVIGFLGVIAVALVGCGLLAKVNWPGTVAHCAPSKDTLIVEVSNILLNDSASEYADALEKLAVTDGGEAVACAVSSLVGQLTAPTARRTAKSDTAVVRGQLFLKQHHVERGQ